MDSVEQAMKGAITGNTEVAKTLEGLTDRLQVLANALERIAAEADNQHDGGEDNFADGYALAKIESASIANEALSTPTTGEKRYD